MHIGAYILAIVVATGSPAATHGIDVPVDAPQCLLFEKPLGYSASGALEKGDTTWYVLQLDDNGTVTRPLFPKRQGEKWAHRSRWTAKAFTLQILVFDGLVGWDITLSRVRGRFSGVATYLTDVSVAGWVPPRVDVSAIEIKCPPAST
jgi:hypothetical protein